MNRDALTYSIETSPGAAEVAELYRAAGLNRPVDDLERIGRMLAGSDLIVCARAGDRLAGIARSVTDFSYACYLSDLAVHPYFQRAGAGRELIQRTREALGPEVALILLAAPSAKDYYGHIGFDHAPNCWMIARQR
ncbi:MAG TPA: GNAT family N-acetyltransferase [Armatimonadota bacterium]|jgi:predicted N-acetyltransferase YhbS